MSWASCAKEQQKLLVSFRTAEDFISVANTFIKNVPIYVDVSLANGVRGEDVARQIFAMGFNNIYLATGYNPCDFSSPPFIKGVIGKCPPFLPIDSL